jgi:hypothetical protein
MGKSKNNTTDLIDNPFGAFKILKGEFAPPSDEDDIQDGEEGILKEEPNDLTETSETEEDRLKKADKALEKIAERTAKKAKGETIQSSQFKESNFEDDSDDSDDSDNETGENEETSAFKEFTKNLYQKGVLDFDDSDEDFEESEEGIEKLVNKTVGNRITKWVNDLPADYSKFLEFVQSGGKPKDFLNVYYGNHSWESFDIEDENKQALAVEESLRLSGEDEDEIRDMVDEWRDNGTLEKRAKSALVKLQKNEAIQKQEIVEIQKQQAVKQKEAQRQYWDGFKNDLFSRENIKGFKLTPKLKEKLWDHMTAIDRSTGKTAYQNSIDNNNEASLLFALQSMLDFDISKLEKQVETKVSNKFGKMLKNYSKTSKEKISGGSTYGNEDGSNPFAAFRKIQ